MSSNFEERLLSNNTCFINEHATLGRQKNETYDIL